MLKFHIFAHRGCLCPVVYFPETQSKNIYMKKEKFNSIYYLTYVLFIFTLVISCKKEEKISLPELTTTTTQVANITQSSAISGGNITSDGGTPITERGVCWSTKDNPTIADSKTSDGSGIGSFTSNLLGLSSNTTYYVRSYATNSQGTYYGSQVSFTTLKITLNVEYVSVAGGSFQMGSNYEDDEKPIHSVTVNSFKISKYEITYAEFIQFLNAIKCNSDGTFNDSQYGKVTYIAGSSAATYSGSNFYFNNNAPYAISDKGPVMFVTWYGANAFCKWVGGRLPTEAEWEFAARGGTSSKRYVYSGSNNIAEVAYYTDNSHYHPLPVGGKQPNELGIYDMTGNVNEWCSDWYGSYESSAQTNPYGSSTGTERIKRGGCWSDKEYNSRITKRNKENPANGFDVGIRVVLTTN